MTDKHVVCTNMQDCHIGSVGIGSGGRHPEVETVMDVYRGIQSGDRYFTDDLIENKAARVRPYRCGMCGRETLRSDPDATTRNNLDNLSSCALF
jgi:hypothetical protein